MSLTLVSFAVTRKAYERITHRFAQEYEAATGQAVRFRLSFGGSGTQVWHSYFPTVTFTLLLLLTFQYMVGAGPQRLHGYLLQTVKEFQEGGMLREKKDTRTHLQRASIKGVAILLNDENSGMTM